MSDKVRKILKTKLTKKKPFKNEEEHVDVPIRIKVFPDDERRTVHEDAEIVELSKNIHFDCRNRSLFVD